MYPIRIAMRRTPENRFTRSLLSTARESSVAPAEGIATKRKRLSATAAIIATVMTTLSMLAPNFFASHFSNLVGSSSRRPSIRVPLSRVFMPMLSMTTILTQPRINGRPIHGCFFERGSRCSQVT